MEDYGGRLWIAQSFCGTCVSIEACGYFMFSPGRGDWVAAVSEVTGTSALKEIHERMLKSSTGREVLLDRPRINVSCW